MLHCNRTSTRASRPSAQRRPSSAANRTASRTLCGKRWSAVLLGRLPSSPASDRGECSRMAAQETSKRIAGYVHHVEYEPEMAQQTAILVTTSKMPVLIFHLITLVKSRSATGRSTLAFGFVSVSPCCHLVMCWARMQPLFLTRRTAMKKTLTIVTKIADHRYCRNTIQLSPSRVERLSIAVGYAANPLALDQPTLC